MPDQAPAVAAVHFLEDRIPWFGRFNGYEQLTRYLPERLPHHITRPAGGWLPRLRGKLVSLRHGLGVAPQSRVDALARFGAALARQPAAAGHVLYGEHFLPFLKALREPLRSRALVTLHQPFGHWRAPALAQLAEVPHRLFLFHPPAGTFEPHPQGSHSVILHGVDTDFFSPGRPPRRRRLLYSGVHLRNLAMLARVLRRLQARDPDLQIDMLVPRAHRQRDEFARMACTLRLTWHADLDERALRDLYRNCTAMFLPLLDSGANTAVVEALACGLPLVTTDVGGIRDYGGGTVYPLIAPDDDVAALRLIQKLLDDEPYRADASRRARRFAEERLAWPGIVAQHLALYERLARR